MVNIETFITNNLFKEQLLLSMATEGDPFVELLVKIRDLLSEAKIQQKHLAISSHLHLHVLCKIMLADHGSK